MPCPSPTVIVDPRTRPSSSMQIRDLSLELLSLHDYALSFYDKLRATGVSVDGAGSCSRKSWPHRTNRGHHHVSLLESLAGLHTTSLPHLTNLLRTRRESPGHFACSLSNTIVHDGMGISGVGARGIAQDLAVRARPKSAGAASALRKPAAVSASALTLLCTRRTNTNHDPRKPVDNHRSGGQIIRGTRRPKSAPGRRSTKDCHSDTGVSKHIRGKITGLGVGEHREENEMEGVVDGWTVEDDTCRSASALSRKALLLLVNRLRKRLDQLFRSEEQGKDEVSIAFRRPLV